MADEARPPSRRARREAAQRARGVGPDDQIPEGKAPEAPPSTAGASVDRAPADGAASSEPVVERPSEIQAGLAYTSELPTSDVTASGVDVSEVAAAFAELEPEGQSGPEQEPGPDAAATTAPASQGGKPQQSMSRKERRRLERLEKPMETWTAEEEARHTGQVPTMTPDAISHQEETARQRVAQAQQEAVAATGGTPQVKRVSLQATRKEAASAEPSAGPQQPAAPGSPQAIPPGGGRPVPMPTGQGAPAQSVPTQGVPQLAGQAPPGAVPGGPPQAAGAPPALGSQAANFESLVSGGVVPPGSKPPTVAVPEVKSAFQSPGVVQAPGAAPASDTDGTPAQPAPAQGPYSPPGQMIVPGTGTLQATSGALRTIPGTGAVPRPKVEIHPAGGIRHFGWPQLLLLAAAAFALGVVIWNVAANGS